MPISITSKPQALALVREWLQKWRKWEDRSVKLDDEVRSEKSHFSHQSEAIPASHISFRISYPKFITTPNPEMIVAAQKDPEFLKALQSADLAIPDGVGVVWALRLLGKRRKGETMDDRKWKVGAEDGKSKIENFDSSSISIFNLLPLSSISNHLSSNINRLSGLDFMESLIAEAVRRDWKVMLVGGKPGIAEKAAKKLQLSVLGYQFSDSGQSVFSQSVSETGKPTTGKPETDLPASRWRSRRLQAGNRKQKSDNRLQIKSISGPQNISAISKSDNDRLITSINRVRPDLLFVAFGHGRQEKWLAANRHRLNAGVAMGVGGALDQIADPSLRPPVYINSIGLGWLYRLFREPWRWRRQLALLKFIWMVFSHKR